MFTVTVFDGDGAAVTQTYTVNVSGADDAPTLAAVTSGSIAEVDQSSTTLDSGLSGTLAGADVDVETLTYGIQGGSDNGDGTVSLAGDYGTLTVDHRPPAPTCSPRTPRRSRRSTRPRPTATCSPSPSTTATMRLVSQTYTVNVSGANDAPVAATVSLGSYHEDGLRLITPAELLAGATDAEGDALTITNLIIATGGGTLYPNDDGTWFYRPAENTSGPVTLHLYGNGR